MKDSIEIWHPDPILKDEWSLWDAIEEERIWATKTSKKDTYDILTEYFGDSDFRAPGCTVKAKSRSQTLSYYDGNANFCNMWKLMKQVDGDKKDVQVSECAWKPANPETDCI